jgi:hypothetical protein
MKTVEFISTDYSGKSSPRIVCTKKKNKPIFENSRLGIRTFENSKKIRKFTILKSSKINIQNKGSGIHFDRPEVVLVRYSTGRNGVSVAFQGILVSTFRSPNVHRIPKRKIRDYTKRGKRGRGRGKRGRGRGGTEGKRGEKLSF